MSPDRKKSFDLFETLNRHPKLLEIFSGGILFYLKHLVRIRIEGQEYLADTLAYVNEGKGGALAVGNHTSMLDILAFERLKRQVKPGIPFTLFWANKFTGRDQGIYEEDALTKYRVTGKIGEDLAKAAQITLVPVPQEAPDRPAIQAVKQLIRRTSAETLGRNGVLGLFPEGTRSRNGSLQRAKEGAVNQIFKDNLYAQETVQILTFSAQADKVLSTNDELHPLEEIILNFGPPFTYAEAQEERMAYHLSFVDLLMYKIAENLPVGKWGAYTDCFRQIS